MKEGVILRCGHRDLENLSNKIRLAGTTAAGLGIQVAHIGHGHVVGEIKFVVPVQVPVEHARAIADGFELLAIFIDPLNTIHKLLAVVEKIPVMIQVVHINLKPTVANKLQIFLGHDIAFFRDNLKRGFNSVGII